MKMLSAVVAELVRLDPELFVAPYEGEGGGTIMIHNYAGAVVAQIECGYNDARLAPAGSRKTMHIGAPIAKLGDAVRVRKLGGETELGRINEDPRYILGRGWEYPVRFDDGSGWATLGESMIVKVEA